MKRLMSLLFAAVTLYADPSKTHDTDLDGVADAFDRCPNTPFDELVDAEGCSKRQHARGNVTLQIGFNANRDDMYGNTTLLDMYVEYATSTYDISLSTLSTNTVSASVSDTEDDLFVTAGYRYRFSHAMIRGFVGYKAVINHTEASDGIILGTNVSYTIVDIDLLGYYSYTYHIDDSVKQGYHTYSLGAGYAFTPTVYATLSFNYAESPYADTASSRTISGSVYVTWTQHIYTLFGYAYGLDEATYDHTFNIAVGVRF